MRFANVIHIFQQERYSCQLTFKVVDARIFRDILAEEFRDARAGSYGAVGETGGDFDLLLELVEDVPEACAQNMSRLSGLLWKMKSNCLSSKTRASVQQMSRDPLTL